MNAVKELFADQRRWRALDDNRGSVWNVKSIG